MLDDTKTTACIDAESLQANTEAVTALEKRLAVVQQILDEVANELGWLTRNLQDLTIGSREVLDETVRCMECDAEPVRSLRDAVRLKWTELMLHEGRYVGLCPECTHNAAGSLDAAACPQRILVDADQFARAMENVEILSEGELKMTCAECGVAADTPADEAVDIGGWEYIGDDVNGCVGLCPQCAERKSVQAAQAAGLEPAEAPREDAPTVEAQGPPPDARRSMSSREELDGPRRKGKSRAKQPLWERMYFHDHLVALVRAVGYAGFPASEGPERMKPLLDKYGEPLMRAAADEIVEIDNSLDPPLAQLTPQARKLAAGILGRPPDAAAVEPDAPPSQETPAAPVDTPPVQEAKRRGRRKAKDAQNA